MAGRVTSIRIPSSTMPGPVGTVADLIAEFPELKEQLLTMTAYHDFGNFDRHSKDFESLFPDLRPRSS